MFRFIIEEHSILKKVAPYDRTIFQRFDSALSKSTYFGFEQLSRHPLIGVFSHFWFGSSFFIPAVGLICLVSSNLTVLFVWTSYPYIYGLFRVQVNSSDLVHVATHRISNTVQDRSAFKRAGRVSLNDTRLVDNYGSTLNSLSFYYGFGSN